MKGFFRGVATAIPTPFLKGKIDYSTLEKLIDSQTSAKIDALVFLGSTGEPCSLSERERSDVFRFAVEKAKGKTKLIFGAGSNDTKTAVSLAKKAEKAGADGLLVVTPFYNKCTQKGLIKHYEAICSNVDIPVLAYNVPSRTGMNILPQTLKKLSYLPNFAGLKDASGNITQSMEYVRLCKDKCDLFVGDDSLSLPLLSLGYKGVISVVSNLVPWDFVKLYGHVSRGELTAASALFDKLLPLINACFVEVNPIPLKTALSLLGQGNGSLRLPLTRASAKTKKLLLKELKAYGFKVEN